MIFYPTESLIYGLFFMSGLFYSLSTFSYAVGFFVPYKSIDTYIAKAYKRRYVAYRWVGLLFLILALIAGTISSFLELS